MHFSLINNIYLNMNEIARNNSKDDLTKRSFNNQTGSKMKNKQNKKNKRKSK